MTAFLKMHGLGNDFAVFDGRQAALALDAGAAKAIADRRTGIGCDQVIVIGKANNADAVMRIFNADGSEVESCGNAARCIGSLLLDETGKTLVRVDSLGGTMELRRESDLITVDYGVPQTDWREIPMVQAVDTVDFALPLAGVGDAVLQHVAAAGIGNPHCIVFVPDAEAAAVTELGPRIEHHPWFPARTNVEFVERRSERQLRMRVWERGVGVTRACGTGACASVVAAIRRGLTERKVDVVLDGGTLTIEWRDSDDHVLMTGPTALTYRGEVDIAALERAQFRPTP